MRSMCAAMCAPIPRSTQKSIEKIAEGDVLEVVLDNPSSVETIMQMC
jgi:TusA-related sulfurtransferase